MIIRCLDIETTGLDATKDAIVEIASVDLRSDGSIISTAETLVQPGTPVSPAASAIHHLIDADLKCAPALADVVQRFVGADAYVAHNCSFEKSFLDRHIGQAVWVCTYKCALRVWPDLESYSSQALRYQLGLIDPLGIDRATLVGKHRGQRFDAVPKDYLRWIAEAPNSLRDDVRSSARYWLNARENQ